MDIQTHFPLLESILQPYQDTLKNAYQPYKNHVYRVINFCLALHNTSSEDLEKIIIAAAFHDLGIWTNNTVDYLDPSIKLAQAYLQAKGQENWINEIVLMIDEHHKVTPAKNPQYPLVEIFRKADWVDVSIGLRSFGLSKDVIKSVLDTFPNLGFHNLLLDLAKTELFTYKRNPIPMMKW